MVKCVIPDSVVAELARSEYSVQICDATGRTIGLYVPIPDVSRYEAIGADLADGELARIEQSDEWYSTGEVLRRLEELA